MSTYFKIAAKSVLALVIYFVLSSLLSVVVSSFWVTQMSQTGITPEEMLRLSETDGFLQLASALIGGCTLVLVAYLFTKVKKLRSTSAMFGVEITLFASLRSLLIESGSSDCGPILSSEISSNVIGATAS